MRSLFVVLLNLVICYSFELPKDHLQQRSKIIQEELVGMVGGTMQLSSEEQLANDIIMAAKYQEVNEGFLNVSTFNPVFHFFIRKKFIEESTVFKIIKEMPKGTALHVHITALLGTEYLVKNITYRKNLYICYDDEDSFSFYFFKSPPSNDDCNWQLVEKLRSESQSVEEFDASLTKHMTLETQHPFDDHKNNYYVWSNFEKIFDTTRPLLTYKPVWEDYFYESLRQVRADNLFYLEFRHSLSTLYNLDGNTYDAMECANILKTINDKFVLDYPDFIGSRLIYSPYRQVTPEKLLQNIETMKKLKEKFGDFVAGFDIVGQEDKGRPLEDFIPQLLTIPEEIDVFYHSGETNWFGTSTDYNLVDAVLFRAKRLGHGYGLVKHPVVSKMVKDTPIAVEVNPVSNQVLMFVNDLRSHPASVFLAENYPVVISSDDPGLWGALPLSHDMYETFVGIASKHSDIRLLKQLALNSIQYSSMTDDEKVDALNRYQDLWNTFIHNVQTNFKED